MSWMDCPRRYWQMFYSQESTSSTKSPTGVSTLNAVTPKPKASPSTLTTLKQVTILSPKCKNSPTLSKPEPSTTGSKPCEETWNPSGSWLVLNKAAMFEAVLHNPHVPLSSSSDLW